MNSSMRQIRARRSRDEGSDKGFDILGIALLAVGLVLLIGLFGSNAGLLGGFFGTLLTKLFGVGAWACPVIFIALGLALILGKRALKVTAFIFGSILFFFAVLGFIARPQGDAGYFDPEAITTTGGYAGAFMGWLFRQMLGDGMWIGLGAVAMVGLILCINMPAHALISAIANKTKQIAENKASKFKKRTTAKQLPRTQPKAVVKMPTEKPPETKLKQTQKDQQQTIKQDPTPTQGVPKEGYTLPPFTILDPPEGRPKRTQAEVQQNIEILENTLEEFGIEATVVEIAHGPTLTRYEIQLGPGVRVSRIKSLADNLAMSLAAAHVRVEAPIPGKAAIGVEVPNSKRAIVKLREVAESNEFINAESKLTVCLGQDVSGKNIYADLSQMPHLLIGGATNSGKSIGLASIISSLLLRNTPKDLRLILLDPKRVELSLFDEIPHLMCPVITDIKQMPGTLRQAWKEMDRRYDLFAKAKTRNILAYNAQATFAERLPYIVLVIDELADLMIQSANEVETSICRLAQLARATGIHLILATQRPSVDVITGTIKANISSRIAYAVSSAIDSRTILDCQGAEQLIGQGDMLFLPIDAAKPLRIQGCFVSEEEISKICNFWRQQAQPDYIIDPSTIIIEREENRMMADEDADPFWDDAVRWVAERGQASTSMLQRRFSIGFQRASRLLDMMEERGIVAPRDGPRPREVLISTHEVDEVLNRD